MNERYPEQEEEYYAEEQNEKPPVESMAGFGLVFFMILIVLVMVLIFVGSLQNPGTLPVAETTQTTPEGPASTWTESPADPAATDSPSPTPTESPEPSPTADESPAPEPTKTTPTEKPTEKPTEEPTEKPTPSPEDSPKPEKPPVKRFHGALPEGPPSLDRADTDLFAGKTGKAFIIIESTSFDGAKAYLIDNYIKKYRPLQFEKQKEANRYIAAVPPGDHTLRIVRHGSFTFETSLPLQDGMEALVSEPLEKRPWFKLESKPPEAYVFIDGKYAGKTPLNIQNLDDTEYGVQVRKKGYNSVTFKMKFERGKGKTKNIKLEPIDGTL